MQVTGIAYADSCKKDDYTNLAGKSINNLYSSGLKYEKSGEKTRALTLYNVIVSRYSDDMNTESKKRCAEVYSHLGDIYYTSRQYTEALNQYLAGLRISELYSFDFITAQIFIGIGNIYSSHNDCSMGIRYYKQALRLAENGGNRKIKNKVLNNLVGASCFTGNISDAERYLKMLQENRENTKDYDFNLLMCKGIVANYKRNIPQSIGYYNKALEYSYAKKLGDRYSESPNSCLAQIYMEAGKLDSALFYLHKNETLAQRLNKADLLEETMRSLSETYESIGNKAEAMAYKIKYVDLYDSIYNNSEYSTIRNTIFRYEARKSENAIQALTQEKNDRDRLIVMQRNWIITLFVAFIVFVVMLIVVYRQKKQLFVVYRELFERSQGYIAEKKTTVRAKSKEASASESSKILSKEQHDAILSNIEKVMETTDVFCQSDFSIETLASIIGTNSRYVSEAINEGYDKNFRTFLNEYRIKEAMRRLSDIEHYGGYTIKAISESVGYKSQANFISVFTKIAGMKPSIYQNISKEKRNISK